MTSLVRTVTLKINNPPFQTRSPPPSNSYTGMCPTSSSPQMPLPPPLTFNSTKNKSKQQAALVSPVNGVPSVTPYTGQAPQSCQVQSQQQRNREVIYHSLVFVVEVSGIAVVLIKYDSHDCGPKV